MTTAAITTLQIALDTLVTNEPINRESGNIEQADLEAKNAADIRAALAVLTAPQEGQSGLKLHLEVGEADLALHGLAQLPYAQVAALIDKLRKQALPQLQPA